MICVCGEEFRGKRFPLVCVCGIILREDGRVIEKASVKGVLGPDGKLQPLDDAKRLEFAARAKERRDRLGRAAWKALHEYRGCDPAWVTQWEKTIPNIGCECLRDYQVLKTKHPFDYSSPDTLFVSGCVLHNAVNEKLGKSTVPLEQALELWAR